MIHITYVVDFARLQIITPGKEEVLQTGVNSITGGSGSWWRLISNCCCISWQVISYGVDVRSIWH